MGHTPKQIFTDDEGALKTYAMNTYFEEQNIKHTITSTHAHIVERYIRSFKFALYKK